MKLYIELIKACIKKFILKKNTGTVVRKFAERMGIVYIKLAQMLATQNFGNLFTEEDREKLSSICDNCNPIPYKKVEKIIKREYGEHFNQVFQTIDTIPVGSASVSQVHHAILQNGDEVAIKIKRTEITKSITKEIKRIKKLMHRFGKIIAFKNYTGGEYALDLYLEWIEQEINFQQEKENIKRYQNFADTVNNKVKDTKLIKIPKLYEEYSTENCIVMEFIKDLTISKMELTKENKEKIATSLNSYIQSSFWAMFHDKKIAFHGDPHSGNICIDASGNICFLDMGLLCELNEEDTILCRNFFLTAYAGNAEKLYTMLVSYGNMDTMTKALFKEDCKRYCEELKTKEVTYYFIDMVNICLKYEFVPPNFLFSMAKAFVCLNGISKMTNNTCAATKLLKEQTMEYLLNRSIKDCQTLIKTGIELPEQILSNTVKYGLVNTIASLVSSSSIEENIKEGKEHLEEMLTLLQSF